MDIKKIRSCVKWNGGKYSELDIILKNIPNFDRYVEPFVGGGAVFWTLKNHFQDKQYHINDTNKHLVNFYRQLRDNYEGLAVSLPNHKNTKDYYLQQRELINQNKEPRCVEMASTFYFINKTSFSGKWQVNKDGVMTTGYANYPDSRWRTWSEIKSTYHKLIQDTEVSCLDFKNVLEQYKNDDGAFIFLDPPYSDLKSMYVDNVDFAEMFEAILHHLKESKAKILMILGDGDLERELFSNFVVEDYTYSYEFYGKATNNKRKHLIIRNY